MPGTPQAQLLQTIANLRLIHASADWPNAEGVITEEIRRIERVVANLDAHHRYVVELVDDAHDAREALNHVLQGVEDTFEHVLGVLAPHEAAAPEYAECAKAVRATLAELRAVKGPPDE